VKQKHEEEDGEDMSEIHIAVGMSLNSLQKQATITNCF
jgi:hypothetical protein